MVALALLLFAIHVDTGFEGGSIGSYEVKAPDHLRIAVKGEADIQGRNRQVTWYAFHVTGAPKGKLTIDMTSLVGEYDYKPTNLGVYKDTPPWISYDRKTWKPVATEYDESEPKLRLLLTPGQPEFWISHVPPYTTRDLERLRKEVKPAEQVIAKTPQGRDLLLWTFGNGPKTVWLMFRQHSWEAGSSWSGDGAVRELARNTYGMTWKVLPMADPDGVARGAVRFNGAGFDLNRNWDVEDAAKMPEITAQRKAIADWLASGHKVDLFLTLHNTERGEYLAGPGPGFESLTAKLFAELQKTSTFAATNPPAPPSDQFAPGRATAVQGLYRRFHIPAYLIEQRISVQPKLGRQPAPPDRMRFGTELVKAIAAALAP